MSALEAMIEDRANKLIEEAAEQTVMRYLPDELPHVSWDYRGFDLYALMEQDHPTALSRREAQDQQDQLEGRRVRPDRGAFPRRPEALIDDIDRAYRHLRSELLGSIRDALKGNIRSHFLAIAREHVFAEAREETRTIVRRAKP